MQRLVGSCCSPFQEWDEANQEFLGYAGEVELVGAIVSGFCGGISQSQYGRKLPSHRDYALALRGVKVRYFYASNRGRPYREQY